MRNFIRSPMEISWQSQWLIHKGTTAIANKQSTWTYEDLGYKQKHKQMGKMNLQYRYVQLLHTIWICHSGQCWCPNTARKANKISHVYCATRLRTILHCTGTVEQRATNTLLQVDTGKPYQQQLMYRIHECVLKYIESKLALLYVSKLRMLAIQKHTQSMLGVRLWQGAPNFLVYLWPSNSCPIQRRASMDEFSSVCIVHE